MKSLINLASNYKNTEIANATIIAKKIIWEMLAIASRPIIERTHRIRRIITKTLKI